MARHEESGYTESGDRYFLSWDLEEMPECLQHPLDVIKKHLVGDNILYFIQVDLTTVKIGSASNIENFRKRLQECQRWVNTPKLLGIVFCDRKVEKLVHDFFFDYQLKSKGRELFALEHDVKQRISDWCDWNVYDNTESIEDFLREFEIFCSVWGEEEYSNEDAFNWDTLTPC